MQAKPVKPEEGKPCNGCGLCCFNDPCGVAKQYIYGCEQVSGPCDALEWENGRYWCGMVRRPSHYMKLPSDAFDLATGAAVYQALGCDKGCCSDAEPGGYIP